MSVLYTNNAKTTLSASLNNSATSLSVASSSGFPSLSGSHYFYATLDDNTNLEVVKVTAVSGTTWTVVRGQDNTSATAFSSGDTIELRLNAALLTDVVNDALASSFTRQDFTGNGSTTAFTLNKTPGSESDLIVFIEGVFQNQADYTLSGTTLTFDEAPASSRKIVVYHVSASVSGDSLALNTFSGDGSTTAFTMSVDPLYENNTMVFIDGVYQNKSTYSTSGTTLTFDAAPANGTSIDVTTHTQQTINVPVDGSVSTAKIAADAVTGAKIADDAINSEHYTDGSIDTAHIANLQVTTGKLAADAVTAAKLADDSVVTANITDDAVTTAKIADDQITLAKLAGLARGKIIYGDSSGNPAALALGSNGQVLKSDGTDIAWATDATVAALTSEEVQDIVGAMFSSNTETGITATYQDADGTVDLVIGTLNQDTTGTAATVTGAAQTNITSLGTLTTLTVDDITINGSTISDAGDLTIDVAGVIKLDADGAEIQIKDGGTEIGAINMASSNLNIDAKVADKDIVFRGIDGSSDVTALTLDMSEAGAATFNSNVNLPDSAILQLGDSQDFQAYHAGGSTYLKNDTGTLIVRADSFRVLNNANSEQVFHADADGAVTLYYDNSAKFATTSTGVQLDGILLSNANGTGGTKATLAEFTSSGSIRSILLKGAENTANQVFLDVVRDINGTETTLFSIADTKIGIGTTSPQRPLQVGAYGTGNGEIAIGSATDGYGSILFGDSATGTALYQGYLQYNHSSGAMLFATLASERMRITSSGEVLIGVTSSTGMSGAGLETAGSIRANNYITSTDLAGSGFRNVNTTSSGSLTTSTSLRELKENIVTTSLGLDAVKALTPREFDWKDVAEYGTEDIGFIADEVFAVSPKLATYKVGEKTEANLQGVKYEQLTAVLVKAIQEQQTIIDDLKARIETLEG